MRFMFALAVFALCGWSAAAQSITTYTYTGRSFNTSTWYQGQTFEYTLSGNITATASFSNLPPGYTGFLSQAQYSIDPQLVSLTISGAGLTLTSATDSLNGWLFYFKNGSIVQWQFMLIRGYAIHPGGGVSWQSYASTTAFYAAGGIPDCGPGAVYRTAIDQFVPIDEQANRANFLGGGNGCAPGSWTLGSTSAPGYSLSVVNPFASYAIMKLAPPTLDLPTVLSSPTANMLAADGESAVVLVYQSTSKEPVTFSVSASGTGISSGELVGSITSFDPNYLVSPNPFWGNAQTPPISPYSCDGFGNCTFLALLWGPPASPVADASPLSVNLTVTATQPGNDDSPEVILPLVPPPLLLVHGLWSNAAGPGFTPGTSGFYDWIASQYPHNQIFPVNYGFGPPACLTCSAGESLSAKRFDDPQIQTTFAIAVDNAIASANGSGLAARTVDVVAHSMGGLVARYYLSQRDPSENNALLPNPIHNLVTVGTPHLGSDLATTLGNNARQPVVNLNAWVLGLCTLSLTPPSTCTLNDALSAIHHPIDTGVLSLEPGSIDLSLLSSSNQYDAAIGEAPTNPISTTESILDQIIGGFLPPQTISSILGGANDTIVTKVSQAGTPAGCEIIPGVVHTSALPLSDCPETLSGLVWAQAFHWLTGGVGDAPVYSIPNACSSSSLPSSCSSSSSASTTSNQSNASTQVRARPADTLTNSGGPPVLNLTGYAQVAASNVSITPASSTTLTIESATSITASSATKTITEFLLLQGVVDPTDTILAYATQSPFSISYTPTRLGSATFSAITVFSDNTFALTTLNYPLQTSGSPSGLTLMNAPAASLQIGNSTVVQAIAQFAAHPVDVTQAATYSTQSGGSSVFSVGAGGSITANGSGIDQLNVSYGGLTASAVISVGACIYSLSPSSQLVSYGGGTVSIGVTSPSGCSWTATGGASWLTFTNPSGAGNGTITLTAAANTTGSVQSATINLANASVLVEQAATACTYGLSQSQINAPAGGASGTINVTTSCPVVASSSASWVTAIASSTSVSYTVAPNLGTTQRTATLTVGTQTVPVVQAAAETPMVTVTPGSSSITTTQALTVTVGVSGGTSNPTPTGSVTLTGGGYTSVATTLGSGSATFTIPAGSLAVGSDMLTANYSPDSSSTYTTATGTSSAVTVTQAETTPTVTVTLSSASITTVQSVTVTVAVSGGTGNPASTGSVTLTGGGYTSAATTLSSGSATITIPAGSLAVGSYTLTASYTPDSNSSSIYNSASGTTAISVTAISPSITFTVPNHTYGDAPFTVSAISNSSGAITYSVVSGPATISGSTVTLTGAGTVVLQASQAAAGNYAAAIQNTTFTVAAEAPIISFSVPNHTYGDAPFTVSATSNSSGAITYSVVSGPATISGSTVTLTGAGTVVLQASQAAAGNYAAGTQNATFTVAAATPAINFTVANQTYGAAPFTVAATSNSSGAFTYSVVSGPATISGSTVTLTGAGTVVLQASQAAAGNYAGRSQNTSFTVLGEAPTISFSVPNHTFGDAPFPVSATSNSSGALTYSVVSGPAIVSGSTVTLTGVGTVVLQASEAEAGNYAAGTQNATFTVATAVPTISFMVGNLTYGAAPFSVTATSNSSGAFTYAVVSGPATISGSTVTLTGAGTVVLQASQAAAGNYAAGTKNATFTVAAATPTISFTVGNQTYGAAPLTVAATSNSSGAFTYSVISGPATISGSTVTLAGAGTVVLQASQTASGNYAAGTQNATFAVAAEAPTISFAVANQTYGAAPFTVAATSNSSGAFTYSVVSGPATISGSTVTLAGAGTVVLQAIQAAAGNYSSGTQTATFTVAAVAPTITFTVQNHTYGDAPFIVAATSNSSGAFTYSVISGPATISGSTATLTGAGTVVLQSDQAAAGGYSAGTQNATFTVAKESQSITFAAPASPVNYGVAPIALSASSSSGLAVTLSVVSGPGSVIGNILTITGAGTVVVAADQAGNANYGAATEVTNSIIVNKIAPLVGLTISPNPVLVQNAVILTAMVASSVGTPTGSVTFSDGGTTLGIANLSGGAATLTVSSLAVGSNSITAVYGGDGNFNSVSSTAVSETVEDFTLTIGASGSSQTVQPGGTATYTLPMSPSGGTTFPAAVTFSVSGLPTGFAATFSPTSLAAGSGATTVTLTVQVPQTAMLEKNGQSDGSLPLVALCILMLPFAGRIRRSRTWFRRIAVVVIMLASAGSVVTVVGCGGGGSSGGESSSQPRSYTLTVTATSGALSHSTTVTLTVQ